MKCSFCGHEFSSGEAETACRSCPLVKGCHLIRCPQCGFEMPPEPKLIAWLRKFGAKKNTSIPKEIH